MSITFQIAGVRIDWDNPEPNSFINLNERNAHDFCEFLGIAPQYGTYRARELAGICRRKLKVIPVDATIQPSEEVGEKGCRVIGGGRDADYLVRQTRALLKLCEKAGELGSISYG